jgi:hypothetical protein
MRTTINVDDDLLAEAKRRAVERGTTLTRVIEDALRETLSRVDEPGEGPFETMTFRGGGLMPGVDIDDSAGLLDLLYGDDEWSSRTSTS